MRYLKFDFNITLCQDVLCAYSIIMWSSVILRHYPLKFAQKMVDMLPSFAYFAKELKRIPEAILGSVLR